MPDTVVVVPCYNEAQRLDVGAFRQWSAAHPEVAFLFVNDGSTDETLAVLEGLVAADPTHLRLLDVQPNGGKAEAVRRGMVEAFGSSARFVAFWDADLATPLEIIPEFRDRLIAEPHLEMVFGSRVRLLGRSIERQAVRHYLGRVGATFASLALGLPVYDTQCGAKMFRAGPTVRALFAEPFSAGWMFDVEILARFIKARAEAGDPPASQAIFELPLPRWQDVAGSKVKPGDFPKAFLELAGIYRRYRR